VELELEGCALQQVPPSVPSMQHLRQLSLPVNPGLRELPTGPYQRGLPALNIWHNTDLVVG